MSRTVWGVRRRKGARSRVPRAPHARTRSRKRRRGALVLAAGLLAVLLLATVMLVVFRSPFGTDRGVTETGPVGLVASPLVVAVDRRGNVLPVDPANAVLDLPVLRVLTPRAQAMWGLRVLARDVGQMADVVPEVFAVVSEAGIDDDEVTLLLGDSEVRLRYQPPISETRLRDAIVALNDAVERLGHGSPREIDLRFADQVVVRTR